jgi:hypothetical protein
MLLAIYLVHAPQVAAQDETTPPNADEKAKSRVAEEHVRRLEVRDREGNEIDLIERPLLAYADPARVNSNGSVWAWGKTGRPVAFLELFQGSVKDKDWVHAVTLTAPRQATLTIPGVVRWQPSQTKIESHVLRDAPAPDKKATTRLRQIKDVARRFTGHEFWDPDNSRFELRVLVQPVLRYSDPEAGIQDGAAFIIAHGTNPETVLLIEALGASLEEARWNYALARSSHAEAHVELDGHEVWKCDRADATNCGSTQSYWLFTSPVEIANRDADRGTRGAPQGEPQ